MKKIRSFEPTDRYQFDFGKCSTSNGWAQIDTSQDASYYGQWANPFTLELFSYCEGDKCKTVCETPEEFCEQLREIKQWNDEQGHKFLGIDPGLGGEIAAKFAELGLSDLLH